MPLKRILESLDSVPDGLRALYVEKDGKFVLDLDGDSSEDTKLKGTLEKERKERQTLEKALKEIKAALGDADPTTAREAMKTLADLEEKALLGELPAGLQAKIDDVVKKRTERIASDAAKNIDKLTGENKTLTGRLEELLIDNAIRAAAVKAGVRTTAVEDAVLYGKTVWKLKDGKPVAMKGDEVLYGKTANVPMSVEEWIADRASDRAHWFEASTGGGATPPVGGGKLNGKVVTLSRDDAKDPVAYRAAKDQASKAGAELVIQ